jgi:hypothetical protein
LDTDVAIPEIVLPMPAARVLPFCKSRHRRWHRPAIDNASDDH